MNHKRHITLENSNIIVKYTNERIIPASGLAVVGALLGKSNFTKKLNHMDVTKNRSQHQIKNGDIILTYIGMLCMGKPYYEAVHEMDDDKEFYKTALGITRSIPSEETLRQRMDDIGDSLREQILNKTLKCCLQIISSLVHFPMAWYLWTLMLRLWTIQRLQSRGVQEPIRDLTAMRQ